MTTKINEERIAPKYIEASLLVDRELVDTALLDDSADYNEWLAQVQAEAIGNDEQTVEVWSVVHDHSEALTSPVSWRFCGCAANADERAVWTNRPNQEPTEVQRCQGCARITRVEEEPVDSDAADGADGYCGNCADARFSQDEDEDEDDQD